MVKCRQPPERKRTERNDAYRVYEEIIKDNIEYDILLQDMKFDHDRLNEIVDLILETLCTSRKKIRIAGDDYPAEQEKPQNSMGGLVIFLVFALLGGGAFYYFKIMKPKQSAKGGADLDDFEFDEYDEDEPEEETASEDETDNEM